MTSLNWKEPIGCIKRITKTVKSCPFIIIWHIMFPFLQRIVYSCSFTKQSWCLLWRVNFGLRNIENISVYSKKRISALAYSVKTPTQWRLGRFTLVKKIQHLPFCLMFGCKLTKFAAVFPVLYEKSEIYIRNIRSYCN